MRTIAIINQKGGCGKTTTAINLAAVLAARGERTLLVDLDPQAHCAAGLAVPAAQIDLDIGDAMLSLPGKGFEPERLLWRVGKDLDLAPSRTRLAGLEATRGGLAGEAERERRLRLVLDHLAERVTGGAFAFCIIDCPPSIGLLTYNAITAADEVLIPVETSFFSLQGASKQVSTIRSLGRRLGTRTATRLVATMHDAGHGLARDLRLELNRRFEAAVSPVTIRHDTALREAASFGQPIIEYAPTSDGAKDYRALGAWLLDQEACADAATIEIKQTDVPLGARRHEAKPAPSEEGRARVMARPLRPGADEDGAAHPMVETRAKADQIEPARVAVRPEPQASTPAIAMETMSRVEDLCRRAQALHQRMRPADRPEELRVRDAFGPLRLVEQKVNRDRREKSLAPLFGARRVGGRMLFVQPIEIGVDVRVAGDFNGWSPTAHPMQRNETLGVHELTLPAIPGRLRYRLVVDGAWREDRFNPTTEPNEFGELNSIVQDG